MSELKPNFTQIPNIILDEYMSKVDPIDSIILFAICRKIYGWHKEEDAISQSQLMEMTGLSRNRLKKGLKFWIDAKVLACTGSESNRVSRRYRLIISDNFKGSKIDTQQKQVKQNIVSHHDSLEGHDRTSGGSQRDSLEGHSMTPQNKEIKEQNISVNKEESIKTELVKSSIHTEYLVNNLPRSEIRQDSITNRINDFMLKLWKQYYQLPYKADLFETDRLAHELDHDWDSFLTLVKAFQTDQYWAKVSMSPRMLRKAWDTLGSRAKVSENAEREKYTNYREHYEQQLMEHEANKKQLKQTADNWKPWNIKEELSKMENGK